MDARSLKDPATVNSCIFVGYLQTEDVDKQNLKERFQEYGNVRFFISQEFGFVQFEDEQSAVKAIQNKDGTMFKGKIIDVCPAQRDNQAAGRGGRGGGSGVAGGQGGPGVATAGVGTAGSGGGGDIQNQNHFAPSQQGGNISFGGGNNSFGTTNDSFGNRKQNFGNANQTFGGGNGQNFANDQFRGGNLNRGNPNEPFSGNNQNSFGGNQSRRIGGDQFSGNQGPIHSREVGNDQFGGINQSRGPMNQNHGSVGNQFSIKNQNNDVHLNITANVNQEPRNQYQGPGNDEFGSGRGRGNRGCDENQHQNRGGENRNNRGNQSWGGGKLRGNRDRTKRNRNHIHNRVFERSGSEGENNNFRDRNPLNRGIHNDDKGGQYWDRMKQGDGHEWYATGTYGTHMSIERLTIINNPPFNYIHRKNTYCDGQTNREERGTRNSSPRPDYKWRGDRFESY